MKPWPKLKLYEVLKPVSREEKVDTSKEYRLLGVRLEGQGPFLRETINGSQTAATKLFQVQKGDFIYSRLFAWRGAFGVIPENLDGCFVSGEFPTFKVVPDKIEAFFLLYWFSLPTTLAQVDENCSGSTPLTRNRFKEQFFLSLEIPLPPLQEQQRIVARIEELSSLINDARTLRQQTIDTTEALHASYANALFTKKEFHLWPKKSLGEIAEIRSGVTLGRRLIGKTICLPYLRVANVQDGHLDLSKIKEVEVLESEADKWKLLSGDLLLTEGGDWDKLGRGTVWREKSRTAFIRTTFSDSALGQMNSFRNFLPR